MCGVWLAHSLWLHQGLVTVVLSPVPAAALAVLFGVAIARIGVLAFTRPYRGQSQLVCEIAVTVVAALQLLLAFVVVASPQRAGRSKGLAITAVLLHYLASCVGIAASLRGPAVALYTGCQKRRATRSGSVASGGKSHVHVVNPLHDPVSVEMQSKR